MEDEERYVDPYEEPYEDPYADPYEEPYEDPYEEPYEESYEEPYEEPYEESQEDRYEEAGTSRGLTVLIRVLIAALILVLLATGAFAFYAFRTDRMETMQVDSVGETTAELSLSSLKHSDLQVVCTQGGQEIARTDVTDGTASFTGLEPDTEYTFTAESATGRQLKGTTSVQAKTDPMVTLDEFHVTDVTAVSATFSVYGTGKQPESWALTLTPASGQPVSEVVTGTEFTVDGLTPETTYTAVIACGDGAPIAGTTECTLTTAEYTVLTAFERTDLTADSMTLSWDYTGTAPEEWTVTCSDAAGNETEQTVQKSPCTVEGLTPGEDYTLTLSCASLRETDLAVLQERIPFIAVTTSDCETDAYGNLVLTWDYEAEIQIEGWRVSCSCASGADTESLETEETEAELTGLIPDTDYQITIETASGLPVTGDAAVLTITTEDPVQYTDYGCSDLSLNLYVREDNPDELTDESDAFTVGQHLAYLLEVHYEATEEEKTVETLYVVRDAGGVPVMAYRGERTWNGAWPVILHEGDLPDALETAGDYTFEIYFDGALAAAAAFTVSE